MKTLPVHCMVSKSNCHLVCMLCSQLYHKPTGFLVIILHMNKIGMETDPPEQRNGDFPHHQLSN